MILKSAQIEDIKQLLALQEKYLVTNMPDSKRSNGFVTVPFTVAQITEVIENHSLIIAVHESQVVAYAFGASWSFFSQWPIFEYMASTLGDFLFDEQLITTKNSFQYGPICVDESQRGTGLFEKIFEAIKQNMAIKYRFGITFINKANERSFAAHTKKLNLEVVSDFEFNENKYHTLAFHTKS